MFKIEFLIILAIAYVGVENAHVKLNTQNRADGETGKLIWSDEFDGDLSDWDQVNYGNSWGWGNIRYKSS
jgi:hypothetical protein